MRGLDLKDVLEIPAPITEQNKDEYLEELSKIKESEDWIKKHSVENKSSINENKIVQNQHLRPGSLSEYFVWACDQHFGCGCSFLTTEFTIQS